MGNNLVLIGGGGHCKSVIDVALRMKVFDKIVITDPAIPIGTKISDCEVVGTDACLEDLYNNGFEYAFITVGNVSVNCLREKLTRTVVALGFELPIIADQSAVIAESASIGKGTFIGKNATVNSGVTIGSNCIINTGAIIEHECIIGDFSHISVGSILCGQVEIGNNSFIGAGSAIIQNVHIGDNTVIGAGTVVNKDIPPYCTAVGNPAKVIKNNG